MGVGVVAVVVMVGDRDVGLIMARGRDVVNGSRKVKVRRLVVRDLVVRLRTIGACRRIDTGALGWGRHQFLH